MSRREGARVIGARPVLDGRYELGEPLGTGGMAVVRRARDLRLGREVAVKLLRHEVAEDEDAMAAFRAEAMSAARLNHPGVVAVHDVGEADVDGTIRPFLVMEMIEGQPLSHLLVDGTPLTVERALEIGVDVTGALAHAHERGVVHRDVTPGNLMVMQNGAVKVTDFGIARAAPTVELDGNEAGADYGSIAYLSPEQARRGTVDARSDLYSVGCLLMTMLTGYPPFRGSPKDVVRHHLRTRPPTPSSRRPGLEPALDEIVLRSLQKDPWRRPQSAAEMRRDLLQVLGDIDAPAAWAAGAHGLASAVAPHEPVRAEDISDLPTARVGSQLLPDAGPEPAGGADTGSLDGPGGEGLTADGPHHQGSYVEGPYAAGQYAHGQLLEGGDVTDATGRDVLTGGSVTGEAMAGHANDGHATDGHATDGHVSAPAAGAVALLEDADVPPAAGRTGATSVRRLRPYPGPPLWTRTNGAWVALVAALVLLGVLALSQWPDGVGPSSAQVAAADVTIPATTNLTVEQASEVLRDNGLAIGDSRPVPSVDVPRGAVVGTDPASGEVVTAGDAVDLVISSGPEQTTVPNLVDVSLGEARNLLEGAGLRVGRSLEVPSARDRGTVLETDPGFGEVVPEGTVVNIVLASGASLVPEVVGLQIGIARGRLEDAGFEVVVQEVDSADPDNVVVAVQPEASTEQRLGTSVTLLVSAGPAEPDVTETATATTTATATATATTTATVTSPPETETRTVTEPATPTPTAPAPVAPAPPVAP